MVVLGLLLAATPALAQPQRPDQQAAAKGWSEGWGKNWSGSGPAPGCSNCSTQRAYESSRRGGSTQRDIKDHREDGCPNCALGAVRADAQNGNSNDYGGDKTGGGAGPK